VRSAEALLAYDQIPGDSPLRGVHESDVLTRFVGAALEVEPIYRQADEIGALNVMFNGEGDELGWHVDNANFVVTLMLQPSISGGAFEYVPMLRSADDPNPDGVRALLTGDRAGVRELSPAPGTLALFRGRMSPHRVTPVSGPIPRINAVLSYASSPGAMLSPAARRISSAASSAPGQRLQARSRAQGEPRVGPGIDCLRGTGTVSVAATTDLEAGGRARGSPHAEEALRVSRVHGGQLCL